MKDSIIAIYLRVADKMPSPSELAYWQSEIALGRSNLATLERLLKADPNSAGDNSAKRNAAGSAWASR